MMSSTEDQLCLNICSSISSSSRKKPLTTQRRWKKQWAEKRRMDFSQEEKEMISSCKQRRRDQEEEEEEHVTQTDQRNPQKEKKKKEVVMETRIIKTSSLFRHNPDIPEILRPVVSQLKEQIFTSDSFSDLDLHPHLVATLNKVLNVSTVTSVQKRTIPVLLSGRDAVVRSQTGSGKTLSYAVPVVQSLQAAQQKVKRSDGPLAVIIVPTRELAQQTFQIFTKLVKPFTWIVPGVLMGGEKRKSEKARLRKGINILISTPGRLVDHIKNTLSVGFSGVQWLILDEADRTLDMGFEKDVTIIVNRLNSSGSSRQNVLLSATLNHGVTRLADVCLNDPVQIQVSGPASSDIVTSGSAVTCESGVLQSESFVLPEALKQYVVVVPSKLRLVCLAAFILEKCKFAQDNKVIVFTSSCETVEFLHNLFTSVLSGPSPNQRPQLSFLRLHGNMKQAERLNVFQQFSVSLCGVLLCTDVAARGLDLLQVTWIVQYTPPTTAAEYVHRVGRTARIGGRGSSLLFLTPAEAAFVNELTNHNISLLDLKLQNILSSLMMDDTYKGRGKYHSQSSSKALEQETRERATVLQTQFENFVHADLQSVQRAKSALQSFLRAYTVYPSHLKHIFHLRSLHLGHAAKSFGLRDAPQGLRGPGAHKRRSSQGPSGQTAAVRSLSARQHSEFSSGLEAADAKKTKKKKTKKAVFGQEEEDQ
ncbi:ATP-dependent DNA helicase DDX31 isoform 1-T2 [Spinachia spinachia]